MTPAEAVGLALIVWMLVRVALAVRGPRRREMRLGGALIALISMAVGLYLLAPMLALAIRPEKLPEDDTSTNEEPIDSHPPTLSDDPPDPIDLYKRDRELTRQRGYSMLFS